MPKKDKIMKTEVITNGGINASVQFKVNIQLSEREARAWDAIVGYGWEAFKEVFYEKLGKSYLEPYEQEAKQMFSDTRDTIGMQLHGIDAVKKSIKELNLQGQNKVMPLIEAIGK